VQTWKRLRRTFKWEGNSNNAEYPYPLGTEGVLAKSVTNAGEFGLTEFPKQLQGGGGTKLNSMKKGRWKVSCNNLMCSRSNTKENAHQVEKNSREGGKE